MFFVRCKGGSTTPEPLQLTTSTAHHHLNATWRCNRAREALPALFAATAVAENWQVRVAALEAIASFGDYAPDQLSAALPDVVPAVSPSMTDTKRNR